MNRLFYFLALLVVAFADDVENGTIVSATPMCIEYADCIHKAQQKAEECHLLENNTETTNGKKGVCTEAKRIHLEIRSIHDQMSDEIETCVRGKADNVAGLNEKKHERCQAILKKNAKRAAIEPQKRRSKKEKNSLKAAAKTCNKEARRLKSQCARLAKCCPAVRVCHRNEDKTELEEKKKALKEATKDCATNGKKGNKKAGKRIGEDREREGKKSKGDNKRTGGLGKSLERAANKKKETPIGGKKLAAALDEMHT
ncbi:Protein CBG08700 [Caenorhabditis briggsae]|uniref:Uncharacterized protein n=2 Tax=Caenorhabditis briggsae TaxID=6238 RepID=A0AAE9F6W2_CAEBR|nr:Protein CBG08700 [Caenorhabditis briggsae]ULT88394.1 hypothetical protein L3Y34_007533 [Caenorhabditis briggsae]UMM34204.1 hypothetical protein L5515_007380 [Caenorhabditis briggsae]CAP28334.1 Protein CBG08700 [Caenorhabditis briggsae]